VLNYTGNGELLAEPFGDDADDRLGTPVGFQNGT
jgi:hypothetical protein